MAELSKNNSFCAKRRLINIKVASYTTAKCDILYVVGVGRLGRVFNMSVKGMSLEIFMCVGGDIYHYILRSVFRR
jgi:hypothetical protein